MITVRSETSQDIPIIYDTNCLAFGQDTEAKLVDELRKASDFIQDLSIVAVEDDKVIGHILFSPIRIEGRNGVVSALALAPMAVRPEYQRKGVGSQLVRYGLDRAKMLGHRIVVVIGHAR